MKKYIRLAFFILLPLLCAGQEITEQRFKDDVNLIINDARSGFSQTIGAYRETNYDHRFYTTKSGIFGLEVSEIVYRPVLYYVNQRETEPEAFWFSQRYSTTTPEGAFILANAERLFDEIAETMKLKKKVTKEKGGKGKKNLLISYQDSSKNRVLYLFIDPNSNLAEINIHSALKPADAPNYLGCLILYNVNSGGYAVSAIALYVYGDRVESAEQLYRNVLSNMSAGMRGSYTKYEWQAEGNRQDIHDKLKSLVGTYDTERINPEGYAID